MEFFKYFFSFEGRLSRLGFLWRFAVWFFLLAILVLAAMRMLPQLLHGGSFLSHITILVIAFASFLFAVIPGLSLHVRRLHDIGLSGWFLLPVYGVAVALKILPRFKASLAHFQLDMDGLYVANTVFACVLLFWPGRKGSNKFDTNAGASGGKGKASSNSAMKRIGLTLLNPLAEDELTMMSIIKSENDDILKIFVNPERNRLEFTVAATSGKNQRSMAKILRSFGIPNSDIQFD